MTFYEMYEELARDDGKIEFKRQQLERKVIKQFKKTTKFPAWELFEYRIPRSRNSYILYFYAENRRFAEKPAFDVFAIVFDDNKRFVITWGCTPYKHIPTDPLIATRTVNMYSSHFFQRYRERILKSSELSINEVVCRYLTRNPYALLMKLNEEIMKKYQEHGERAGYGMKVRDGICLTRTGVERHFFGDNEEDIVYVIGNIYITFINEGTLTGSQKEAVMYENIRCSNELIKTIISDLK